MAINSLFIRGFASSDPREPTYWVCSCAPRGTARPEQEVPAIGQKLRPAMAIMCQGGVKLRGQLGSAARSCYPQEYLRWSRREDESLRPLCSTRLHARGQRRTRLVAARRWPRSSSACLQQKSRSRGCRATRKDNLRPRSRPGAARSAKSAGERTTAHCFSSSRAVKANRVPSGEITADPPRVIWS